MGPISSPMPNYIYRIQDAQGRGPYKPGETELWKDEDRDHPAAPSVNQMLAMRRRAPKGHYMGFGFESMDQLRAWFSEGEIARLYYRGYSIVKMGVTGFLMRESTQCAFHRRYAFTQGIEVLNLWGVEGHEVAE